ncbi:acid protease [Diplodia corticola]|uniref:Acid protease n=1 Tax=Diplodia corticola TaxID=236234 RepID=A0A1J9R9G6_9PEZI|nr:acid protease [Diplodia corticola]OJD36826.1 acid protease [Diplodia corticola]
MAVNPVPSPYIAVSTKQWDGIDGNWSTFRISIGESDEAQNFRVLVSTRGASAWVPLPGGCEDKAQACPSSRGVDLFRSQPSTGFQSDGSSTWNLIGIFSLDLENNLGFANERGKYGYDTIRLGFSEDKDALEIEQSLVVGIHGTSYWIGLLGMSAARSVLDHDNPPGLIEVLNDAGKIPSLSYGYTAGAHYRGIHGSLVIGGYDQSRFQLPGHNFSFADSQDQFLIVGVQSIDTNFSLTAVGSQELVGNGHLSSIDSTVSELWLPEDVCNNFAAAFGLIYDERSTYYTINDTMHNKLLAENPTLTFRLGNGKDNDPKHSIQIELPYAALDLFVEPPAYPNKTRYFPVRRAENDTQYTIGRTLLQEAYLTVHYERNNFSLAQANWSDHVPVPDIRTIHSTNWTAQHAARSLSGGAEAGVAIGTIAGAVLVLGALYLYCWRPRRLAKALKKRPSVASQAPTYQEPPPHYQEAKQYDPWGPTSMQQHQQSNHDGRHASMLEMPAGAEHQARRPELDGAGVGGSSYELPAPVEMREAEGQTVHEMDVGGDGATDAAGHGTGDEVERR